MDFDTTKRLIALWHTSDSVAEVAKSLGLDRRAVSNRAAHLRRRGVALPALCGARHGRRRDLKLTARQWEELRAFAASCGGQKVAPAGPLCRCGREIAPQEASAYGGRCEDCFIGGGV